MRILAGIVCLAVVGCATPSAYWPTGLPAFLREDVQVAVETTGDAAPETSPVSPPCDESRSLPTAVHLPQAIQETLFANLRIRASGEKVRAAQADFIQDSLLPNPEFYLDGLMLPLRRITPERQAGPSQMDFTVTLPIDWLVFGKRAAAKHSARLGVDVASADLADLVRQKVTDTVVAFYDALEARDLVTLAKSDIEDHRRLEALTQKKVDAGAAPSIELDRMRLMLVDARRELRKREIAYSQAKSKLRTLMGRAAIDPPFEPAGTLEVTNPVEPMSPEEARALAEQHRPDLISLRRQIDKAEADIKKEKTKAYPPLSIQPILTHQFQRPIGFPDATTYGFFLNSTMPLFNRNQGGIAKAEASYRESLHNLKATEIEISGEIDQALDSFKEARTLVVVDSNAILNASRSVRDKTELGYRTGNQSLLDLLTEQEAYRQHLRNSVSSMADYWRSLHRLNAAVGIRAMQ